MNRAERLRSLGVLFTIIAVVIIFFGYKAEDFYSKSPLWSILLGLLLFLIIVLTYFWGSIDEYYKERKNKKIN